MFCSDGHDFNEFEKKVWLSSPKMHGEELLYIKEAYDTNWMSTIGENINVIEKNVSLKTGCKTAVALSSGTAALHMAVKLAGEEVYGGTGKEVKRRNNRGILDGHRVFCSDMTFAATVNPVIYEGGEPVFIDTEYETWNISPAALLKAFEKYPDVRIVIAAHLYGTPARIDGIKEICKRYNAILIEDAAESFGASYMGRQTGTFGKYGIISFNGNKIITGSSGGMLLTDDKEAADKARKWSTQSRDAAPWYQHSETGYNYRMSNVIAGVVRGQLLHLDEHIENKKIIWERYREGFKDIPVTMNPAVLDDGVSNFWLSCILIDKNAMCRFKRSGLGVEYIKEHGKSCPTEILEVLNGINAEGRHIWKPMHMQPIFEGNGFITGGCGEESISAGEDIFNRGVCLPSDINMTALQQSEIIEAVKACFQ